ncbi:MAG: HAMP domain-containing histidine kinase [Gemmatimonadetes bacterium]|nr:HAMP domain-containing histidine kinase [Gemmatimonadota bacterium]
MRDALEREVARHVDALETSGSDAAGIRDDVRTLGRLLREASDRDVTPSTPSDARSEVALAELESAIEVAAAWRTSYWTVRRERERSRAFEICAALLSHELGNRLGVADTATRLLQEGAGLQPPQVRRLQDVVLSSVEAGISLTRGVRHAMRSLLRGDADVPRLALDTLARDLLHQSRARATVRGLGVSTSGAFPPLDVHVLHFCTAFANLLDNAVEHHDLRSGALGVQVQARKEGQACWITIRDDGPGLPDDLVERPFRPRVRGPLALPDRGLGLAMTEEAIRAAGGEIRYASPAEGGCEFSFMIPALAPLPAP